MDCLNRFKVLLIEPQYLTHLLLEGGDLGPRAPIAAKGLIGGDWGPGDPGPGAPIATWGPDCLELVQCAEGNLFWKM